MTRSRLDRDGNEHGHTAVFIGPRGIGEFKFRVDALQPMGGAPARQAYQRRVTLTKRDRRIRITHWQARRVAPDSISHPAVIERLFYVRNATDLARAATAKTQIHM
jgi:hypothetical protein